MKLYTVNTDESVIGVYDTREKAVFVKNATRPISCYIEEFILNHGIGILEQEMERYCVHMRDGEVIACQRAVGFQEDIERRPNGVTVVYTIAKGNEHAIELARERVND